MKSLNARRPRRTHVTWFAAVTAVAAVITLSGIGMGSPSPELPRTLGRPNPEGTSI